MFSNPWTHEHFILWHHWAQVGDPTLSMWPCWPRLFCVVGYQMLFMGQCQQGNQPQRRMVSWRELVACKCEGCEHDDIQVRIYVLHLNYKLYNDIYMLYMFERTLYDLRNKSPWGAPCLLHWSDASTVFGWWRTLGQPWFTITHLLCGWFRTWHG